MESGTTIQDLEDELTLQMVMLRSIEDEDFEGVEEEREQHRIKIAEIKSTVSNMKKKKGKKPARSAGNEPHGKPHCPLPPPHPLRPSPPALPSSSRTPLYLRSNTDADSHSPVAETHAPPPSQSTPQRSISAASDNSKCSSFRWMHPSQSTTLHPSPVVVQARRACL